LALKLIDEISERFGKFVSLCVIDGKLAENRPCRS
jgi:hypothetical protein